MYRRLAKIREEYKNVENDFNYLNAEDTMKIIMDIKDLKGKSFDAGCTYLPGSYKFNQTYKSKPELMLSMNGLELRMTNTSGTIKNQVSYIYDKESLNITSIVPMKRDFPVCWLVVPPKDEKSN